MIQYTDVKKKHILPSIDVME